MANPNFIADYSTNQIFRNLDQSRCLTDDLDAMDDSIAALSTGKAATDHTHAGYAASNHSHTGYAEANHEHTGYANADHTHDYAAPTHPHAQSDISGLIAALSAKAEATHDHTLAQIVGLVAALAAKADLVDGKVPASQLPGYVDDIIEGHLHNATTFYENISDDVSDTVEVVPESGKVYLDTNTNKIYRWSGTSYVEIPASLALGETSATAYRGDRGKTAYDHSQNGDVHVTTAQKTAWDGKAAGNHNHDSLYSALSHIHPTIPVTTANEDLNNYFTAGIYSFAASYQPVNRPEGTSNGWLVVIPWNANPATGTVKQFWLRHGTLGSNDHEIFVRTKIGDSGWSSWSKIYTTSNPPTAAEVGAAAAMVYNSATSATTYKLVYVGTNGDDDNTGFSTNAPMATIKGVIRKYAEKYKMLDIRLLDGTYNEDIGSIATDVANLSIRSVSENKDAVTINMATHLDLNSGLVRLYNMTLNVTETGVRGISLNAGALYAYGIRINVPTDSTISCVNVYNGTHAFLMNCVLNAGTGSNAGAAIYGNQAMMIKAINCTSERKVNIGVHAYNGSDIEYTDTINATTKTKQTSWGKCTLRS